jgi:putative toxin-antitoxin system antitoxin component (TIGR02293 family)
MNAAPTRETKRDSNDSFKIVFSEPKAQVRKILMGKLPSTIAVKSTTENLCDLMGLKKGDVHKLIGFTASRKSRNDVLDLDAIDRIFNTLETRKRVEHFLGSDTDEWLKKPNKHLENKAPLELIETRTGTQMLLNYLDSLESGHYL